ncbi:hypothetical protein ENE75_05575 [Rubrivivax albus]|uniref:Uncharacterized protein n=2 Tax=Rubrivivax albus TaxID=2499835 RepID=A0A3S2U5R9_9BURK|nr:hypothetical protein ENE75_05575 [Rubrivivax albus]
MMTQTPASALNGVAQPLVCRPEAPLRVRPPIAADLADARRRLKAWLGARPWQAVSLGQNCNVAWYLSQVGAKAFSGPFDWIFSAASIVAACLEDDFTTFLDRSQMVPIRDGSAAGHLAYHASMFNHRSPLSTEADHAYYVRCVGRFRALLSPGIPVVFVCQLINEPGKRLRWANGFKHQHALPLQQTAESYAAVRRLIQAKNQAARFVFIDHRTQGTQSLQVGPVDRDTFTLAFEAQGRNDGVKYVDQDDDAVMRELFGVFGPPPSWVAPNPAVQLG